MRITKIALLLLLQLLIFGGLHNASAGAPQSNRGEEHIKREVRHELIQLPFYSVFDNLAYSVNGSQVTLSGQVTRPSLKSDAEKAVKSIEGVDRVNNQIEVLPTSIMDDQIRRAVYRALYSKDNLARYGLGVVQGIHIIVNNGHVTLEGVVDSEGDKNSANIYANSVPGVFSVTNHLVVSKS